MCGINYSQVEELFKNESLEASKTALETFEYVLSDIQITYKITSSIRGNDLLLALKQVIQGLVISINYLDNKDDIKELERLTSLSINTLLNRIQSEISESDFNKLYKYYEAWRKGVN